jgi:chromosomal replication initiation ATPase DnaA
MHDQTRRKDRSAEASEWDVFISYNNREKFWVRRVVKQWRELGLKVFFAEDTSIPGEPIYRAIQRGIKGSRYVVCMLSNASAESEWVRMELVRTVTADPSGRSRRLIPVFLEEDIPDSEIEWIKHLNCVTLWDPEIRTQEYVRLLRSLDVKHPERVGLPPISPDTIQWTPTSPETTDQSPLLYHRYTFDRFVVGNNNQLAAAAAHGVSEAPARLYNPLFIYGGVGLGKTHLMHAIGHAILERDPNKRVAYLSSEQFTNELVSAIQEGSMQEFRRHYRQIDLLLVDDIHFLEGKERTQEEFFHTFNALHNAQRQIVLTSDRPPTGTGLEDRLVSRFEWGMVADIKRPDFETRVAILRRQVEEDGLIIHEADEVLALIARHRTSSIRELEGSVIKLLAYSSLTRRPIDLRLTREALGLDAGENLLLFG